jgi:hypothetical protein
VSQRAEQWQQIETAPKDGTYVVLVGKCKSDWPNAPRRSCISRWCEKVEDSPFYIEGWPFASPGFCDVFLATHWMPLPDPPKGDPA